MTHPCPPKQWQYLWTLLRLYLFPSCASTSWTFLEHKSFFSNSLCLGYVSSLYLIVIVRAMPDISIYYLSLEKLPPPHILLTSADVRTFIFLCPAFHLSVVNGFSIYKTDCLHSLCYICFATRTCDNCNFFMMAQGPRIVAPAVGDGERITAKVSIVTGLYK